MDQGLRKSWTLLKSKTTNLLGVNKKNQKHYCFTASLVLEHSISMANPKSLFVLFHRLAQQRSGFRQKKRSLRAKLYTSKEAKNFLTVNLGSTARCDPYYLRTRSHYLLGTLFLSASRRGDWRWVQLFLVHFQVCNCILLLHT